MLSIDLNCDLGESYGAWSIGNDQAILPLVTSINVACGYHAGDPTIMHKTIKLALENNIAIGAHPSTPDLVGFGRRNMAITPQEAYDMVIYQVGALNGFLTALGGQMHHVKPHGALYNMAAGNADLALAIAKAVRDCTHSDIVLYGLANSESIRQAEKIGLRVANEVFADRTYQKDATLTPRSQPNALIQDDNIAIEQVLRMVEKKNLVAVTGETVSINADTICIHGDGAHALLFANKIREALTLRGIKLSAM